jgi:undecaprenyl-diphosphatase
MAAAHPTRRRWRAMPWLRALTLRTLALFGLAAIASIGFAVLAAAVRAGALDQLDTAVELAIHRLDSAPADAVMRAATTIGSNLVLLPAVAAVTALAIHQRRRAVAVVLVIDSAVVIAAYSALKVMFSRERPQLFEEIALPTGYSFPSGHTMSAIGIYGAIAAALIALYPRARAPVILAAVVLIAAIGLSRIYLGVHWPSDVVGGLAGGVPPLVASIHLIHRPPARDRNLGDLVESQS